MIKLVVSDVDGTLVEDGSNYIDPRLLDAVVKLREKGLQFAVASGRPVMSIERLFEPIRNKIFYLADNGAYVGCYGRILYTTPVNKTAALELIQEVRQLDGCELVISGPRMEYLETKNEELVDWVVNGYGFEITRVEDLTQVEDEIIKVSIYKKQGVFETAGHLIGKYKDRIKGTISGDMWIDFNAPEANKGNAVGLLQESLGYLPEETIVFGDQQNDVEMMKRAYHSYAVGNAKEEVKSAARYVTGRNTEGGVLTILNRLLDELQ